MIMDEQELELFREAGRMASRIREDSKRLIMVGESLLDIAETMEQMGQQILTDVRKFVAGYKQSDDMCLVCFTRKA